jgi:hypothetical protein
LATKLDDLDSTLFKRLCGRSSNSCSWASWTTNCVLILATDLLKTCFHDSIWWRWVVLSWGTTLQPIACAEIPTTISSYTKNTTPEFQGLDQD